MIPVPEWAGEALASTFTASWSATLYPPAGGNPVVLPLAGGSLRQDATRYPRTECDLEVAGLDLAPRRASDPLTPFGTRLGLDYTLTDSTGRSLTFRPVPTLLVDDVEVVRGDAPSLTVSASDPSLAVDTDAFPVPTDAPANAREVSAAIAWLIRRTFPAAVIDDAVGSTRYVGKGWQTERSPWSTIEALADGIGAEVFIDYRDRWQVRRVPAQGAPVAVLKVGEGGTLTRTRSRLLRGYNRVVLVFRSSTGASRGGYWSDLSGGALDVRGPYGRVTFADDRDGVLDAADRDAAASRLARRTAGKVREVEVEGVTAPWLQLGDTLAVGLVSGVSDLVLDAVDHDLAGLSTRYTFRTDTVGPT